MRKYKSICISDVHLGTKGCKAEWLCDFLKNNTSDNLFLVGDIIDGWALKRHFHFPQSHMNVIRRILTAAKRGTNVIYLPGNHDEILRQLIRIDLSFGNIEIRNQYIYEAVNGKSYIICHGDMFDTALQGNLKFLYHLGDYVYDILLSMNTAVTFFRRMAGLGHWSFSAYVKDKTKAVVKFISDYENLIADYCKRKCVDGIICGHIHQAAIKEINGITYMNDGDWVESCTALVEHHDGTWEILKCRIV